MFHALANLTFSSFLISCISIKFLAILIITYFYCTTFVKKHFTSSSHGYLSKTYISCVHLNEDPFIFGILMFSKRNTYLFNTLLMPPLQLALSSTLVEVLGTVSRRSPQSPAGCKAFQPILYFLTILII